jgi:FtsP/CotA-like multicopper oxidase with cupredoxin domain
VYHGIAPEADPNHPIHKAANDNGFPWDINPEKHFAMTMVETTHEFVPDIQTPVFAYDGLVPGPTICAEHGTPHVQRITNMLPVETSLHLHGAHNPAHPDGFPDFYVLPNKTRDYYYPNTGPREGQRPDLPQTDPLNNGDFAVGDLPTTMWYHDHGMDITGFNDAHGLAGFYLVQDQLEKDLIAAGVLPEFYGECDIPLALQDQVFNSDGSLFYDLFDHNGRLGNVFCVNGVAQPFFEVKRKKYRFRILNASNARIYHLRLSSRRPFLQIGQDSWEFPKAIRMRGVTIPMAQRADIIVDFSEYDPGDKVYLENIMFQPDGRGPDEIDPRKERTGLVQFRVTDQPVVDDISVVEGTMLRPFTPIHEDEICAERTFEFDRRQGAWQVNDQFFSPRRTDAVPALNSAECWTLRNNSGGWYHPIHIHLEAHQIQTINGEKPPKNLRYNVDVTPLWEGDEVKVFMKFRTFTGPFVFHCHNLEHEDMRMMGVFDPRPQGAIGLNNGVRPHNAPAVDFVDEHGYTASEITGMPIVPDPEDLFFDQEGDVDRLEDRGVGFPDFDQGGETTPPNK